MFQAPSAAGLPPLSVLLDSISIPPARLARHLGISRRTMDRYRRADQAPRPIMLALFWESPWGRGYAFTTVFNEARQHAALARSLGDALHRSETQLLQLLRAYGEPRAANDPLQLDQLQAGHALKVLPVGGDQVKATFQTLRRDQWIHRAARVALAEELGRFQAVGAGDGFGGHSVG